MICPDDCVQLHTFKLSLTLISFCMCVCMCRSEKDLRELTYKSEKDLTAFVNNLLIDDVTSPAVEPKTNSENNESEAESSEEPPVEEGVVTDGCEEVTKPSSIDESPPEISELEEGPTEDEEVNELIPPVVSDISKLEEGPIEDEEVNELIPPLVSDTVSKNNEIVEPQEGLSLEEMFGVSDLEEVLGDHDEVSTSTLFSTAALPPAYWSFFDINLPSYVYEGPTVLDSVLQPAFEDITPQLSPQDTIWPYSEYPQLDVLSPDTCWHPPKSPSSHDETFPSSFTPLEPVQCQGVDAKSSLPAKEACVSPEGHRKRLRKREGDDSVGGQELDGSCGSVVKLPNACPSGLCKEIWLSCDLYENEKAHEVQTFCNPSPTMVSLDSHYSSSAFVGVTSHIVRPTSTEMPPKPLTATHSMVTLSCVAFALDEPAVEVYLVEPEPLPGHYDLLPPGAAT